LREARCWGASVSKACTRTFASTRPGLTEVIVKIAVVHGAYDAQIPARQFWGGFDCELRYLRYVLWREVCTSMSADYGISGARAWTGGGISDG
jgi:hypothetical protein